jgi:uncharacterized protein YkwD
MKRIKIPVIFLLMVFLLTACTPPAAQTPPSPSSAAKTPAISGALTPSPRPSPSAAVSAAPQTQNAPEPTPTPIPVSSVAFEASVELRKGTEYPLHVQVLPRDATRQSVFWASSDPSVVSVSETGLLYGVGGGTASVTATASNGVTGTCLVTVTVPVDSLRFDAEEVTLNRDDTLLLRPFIAPADATERDLVYTSGDDAVASVASDGTVLARGAGSTIITCAAPNGAHASCRVTVVVPVQYLTFEFPGELFRVGDTVSFAVALHPADATDKRVSVSLEGEGAELSGETAIYFYAGGEAILTATAADGAEARITLAAVDLNAFAEEVLRLTNEQRAVGGLPPLASSSALLQTAFARARELPLSFSHDRPDGRSCFTAFEENGAAYLSAGENIAYGYTSPAEVVGAWMDSPGHRENILNVAFGRLGVGVELSGGTLYWSQAFSD